MSAAFSREHPFLLSTTVDFPDDVGRGACTHELLDAMMVQLKSLGVSRVYWLYYGDIDPKSYWATDAFGHGYGPETVERIGEPVSAAVPVARRHGLEIYAVVKKYDLLGGWGTYPLGYLRVVDVTRAGQRTVDRPALLLQIKAVSVSAISNPLLDPHTDARCRH